MEELSIFWKSTHFGLKKMAISQQFHQNELVVHDCYSLNSIKKYINIYFILFYHRATENSKRCALHDMERRNGQ